MKQEELYRNIIKIMDTYVAWSTRNAIDHDSIQEMQKLINRHVEEEIKAHEHKIYEALKKIRNE